MSAQDTKADRASNQAPQGTRWRQPFGGSLIGFAVVLWVILLSVVCIRAYLLPGRRTVYPIYANAGQNWLDGIDIYQLQPPLDCFPYAPLWGAFFVPLSTLPAGVGDAVWRLLSVGSFLAALLWFFRRAFPGYQPHSPNQMAVLLLLTIPLSVSSIANGQINVVLMALLLASATACADKRWNVAALCVALAGLMKVYPLALGLLLGVVYPKQMMPRLACALAIALAVPFVFQQPGFVTEEYRQWMQGLRNDDRHVESDYPNRTCDPRSMLRALNIEVDQTSYFWLQLSTGAATAVLAWRAGRKVGSHQEVVFRVFGLACAWMICFGPATEACTYILLAPTLACVTWDAFANSGARKTMILIHGLFGAAMVVGWFPGPWFIGRVCQPLAGLIFFGTRYWAAWRITSPKEACLVESPSLQVAA